MLKVSYDKYYQSQVPNSQHLSIVLKNTMVLNTEALRNQFHALEEQYTQAIFNMAKAIEVDAIKLWVAFLKQAILKMQYTIKVIRVDNLGEHIYEVKSIIEDLINRLDGLEMERGQLGDTTKKVIL